MEKLWTTSEAASFLSVSESEIERLVKTGELTGYKLGGRFLRFRPEQVEALKGRLKTGESSPSTSMVAASKDPWIVQISEFFYFYDFYLLSGLLLIALAAYVVWTTF